MNGAALIHDFEIAIAGNTSEDVDAGINAGQFGMARETGEQLNEIAKNAARSGIGYGEAAGQFLTSSAAKARYASSSVVAAAYRRRIPVTVHLAIGADIPHMHPAADGAALGAATYQDFLPLLRAGEINASGRRIYELGLGRASAGDFLESGFRGAQFRRALAPDYHRQF